MNAGRRRAFFALVAVAGAACTRSTLDLGNLAPPGGPAIAALTVTAGTNQATLAWSPLAGAQGYDVFAAMDPGVSPSNYASLPGGRTQPAPGTSARLTTLDPTATWFFVVAATTNGTVARSPTVSTRPLGKGALAPGLASSPAWSGSNPQASSRFGAPVVGAGDVDKDGFGDVLIGAYQYTNGQTEEGILYLYRGGPNGLVEPPIWSNECNQTSAHCGTGAVAADFDGDGKIDVVEGASDWSGTKATDGRAQMFRGIAGGVSTSPSWTFESGITGANTGRHLALAGDFNHDGKADLLVPTHGYANGQANEGCVQLFLGTASGLTVAPVWTGESNDANAIMGWSLAAGDFNGDGFTDVVAGGIRYSGAQPDEGKAYFFNGTPTVPSTAPNGSFVAPEANARIGWSMIVGDFDGDGYDDVAMGSPYWDGGITDEGRVDVFYGGPAGLPATPSWTRTGGQPGALFGAALAAADVNGDGIADLLVGAPGWNGHAGRVLLYFGRPNGLPTTPAWTLDSTTPDLYFGGSIGAAGDVNGDGRADVIVGVFDDYTIPSTKNGAWLFFGPPSVGPTVALAAPPAPAPVGAPAPLPAASFTDPAPPTTHTCLVDWGDGTPPAPVDPCDANALAALRHPFARAGAFTVRLRVVNGYGLSGESATVIVAR